MSSAMDLRTEDVTQLKNKERGSEEGERAQLCYYVTQGEPVK